jgi:hypothetical protein
MSYLLHIKHKIFSYVMFSRKFVNMHSYFNVRSVIVQRVKQQAVGWTTGVWFFLTTKEYVIQLFMWAPSLAIKQPQLESHHSDTHNSPHNFVENSLAKYDRNALCSFTEEMWWRKYNRPPLTST